MERIRPSGTNDQKPAAAPRAASAGVRPSLQSKVLVLLLIIAAGLVVVILSLSLLRGNGIFGNSLVDGNKYQAVFLDNGQVYFGKLSKINSEYAELTDIYYLQVTQQQADGELQEGQNAAVDPQISLAKLGNELHKPEDRMFIDRDKILFWENIEDDGQVVQAIKNFSETEATEEAAQE